MSSAAIAGAGGLLGRGRGYTPLQEGDCAIGLIADTQYITVSTGVSAWKNLGNKPDLLQSTPSKQPAFNPTGINGKGGVFGDAVNDQLDLNPYLMFGTAVTVVVGLKLGSLDTYRFVFDVHPSERLFSLTVGTAMQNGHSGDAGQVLLNTNGLPPSTLVTGERRCISHLVDAAEPVASEVKCRVDGVLDPGASFGPNNTTLSPATDTLFSLFSGNVVGFFADHGIRQVWLFEKLLTPSARARVESFVMADLGI
jgi:hypothetical protein